MSLLAVFAVSAVAAAGAQAVEGPFYKESGARLLNGNNKKVTIKQNGNQVLKAGTTTLTCTGVKEEAGTTPEIKGSTGKNSGTDTETLEYTGCTVTGWGTCTAPTGGVVKTQPLESILGYAKENGTTHEGEGKLLTLFRPVGFPTNEEFTGTITFEPAGCHGSTKVKVKSGCSPKCEGIIGEDWNGEAPPKELTVGVNEVEALTGEVRFPAAAIGTIFTEATTLTKRRSGLEAFAVPAEYVGKVKVEKATGNWGVCTKVLGPAPKC